MANYTKSGDAHRTTYSWVTDGDSLATAPVGKHDGITVEVKGELTGPVELWGGVTEPRALVAVVRDERELATVQRGVSLIKPVCKDVGVTITLLVH
jgi:hypothetical protein